MSGYRGLVAPSPTGLLQPGYTFTFWSAQYSARQQRGTLFGGTKSSIATEFERNSWNPCTKIFAGWPALKGRTRLRRTVRALFPKRKTIALYRRTTVLWPNGRRLAKRHGDLSIRKLPAGGWTPEMIRSKLFGTANGRVII